MTELLWSPPGPPRSHRGLWISLTILLVAAIAAGVIVWTTSRHPPEAKPAPAPETNATPVVEAPPPAPPPPPTGAVAVLVGEARSLYATNRFADARAKAYAALDAAATDEERALAEATVADINLQLLMSPRPMAEKTDYTVQEGDSLDRIARKFGTTVELIQKSNNIRGSIIRPGDRIRVFSGAWSIVVNKTRNDLLLKLNDRFFKRYRVGTGEYSSTPVGTFKITDRIAQPTWWHPDGRTIAFGDPENLLGTHWLALDVKGYGLHGTWEPQTIGHQSSMGCVRLVNEEIEQLFTLVTIGTPVTIEE